MCPMNRVEGHKNKHICGMPWRDSIFWWTEWCTIGSEIIWNRSPYITHRRFVAYFFICELVDFIYRIFVY